MSFRFYTLFSFAVALIHMAACQKKANASADKVPSFASVPAKVEVNPMMAEASGIADSKKNARALWVEEDSGAPPEIYLLDHKGTILKEVFIKGSSNRDWEDIALSNGKIYIAETGDNAQGYTNYAFYVFPEPNRDADTVYNFEKISFRYPDGSHDAEAFLVEPSSGNIYVITKRDSLSGVYKLSAPFNTSNTQTVEFTGQLKFTGVTSASISSDGKEIILKTYTSLFYYKLHDGETIESIFKKDAVKIPYELEPQGEAVCFASDNTGYFTLSEKGFSSKQYLCFYKKD